MGFADKIPSFIKNRLPKLGPIDLAQGEIDLGASFEQKTTYVCSLLDCYPTTITDQTLGNAEEGIMEIQVQLSFSDWTSKKGEEFCITQKLPIGRKIRQAAILEKKRAALKAAKERMSR